ncbi:conserved hypothetical protein [metagenome]|uniref:Uncharacterized protein n=1 Tax=metagenome TaxID=256318 RepID=A0A2P2C805_9ZZZZ
MTEQQLAFDIEGMIHEAAVEAAPEWSGAPLHFTTAYFSPAALDAAFEHWQFLHKLDYSRAQSHMWHRAITVPGGVDIGDHGFDFFTADLRCEPWKHDGPHGDCMCVGDLAYMATCEPHGWHVTAGDENSAVEGWHDHAFPGWRDLPILPARLRDFETVGLSKAAMQWIENHYPESMQVVGAPVITERSSMGTRHVPGRSPWGGYDISHTAVDPSRTIEPRRRRRTHEVALEPPRASATPTSIGLGD